MKTSLKFIAGFAAIVLLCSAPALHAQTQAKAQLISLGPPPYIASGATSNNTSSAFLLFRERPVSFATAGRSIGIESVTQTGFLEFTTNRPSDSSTNWFRPVIPVSVLLSTNHSLGTAIKQTAVLANSSIPEGFAQARFWSFVTTGTTNAWTNSAITSVVIP